MNIKTIIAAAAVLTLGAIATQPADAAVRNGQKPNGISLNAISQNGISLNAISQNGVSLNAISQNGIRLQGKETRGQVMDAQSGAEAGFLKASGGRLIIETGK